MTKSADICVLYDAEDAREAERLVEVLEHLRFHAVKQRFVAGGGLPRNIVANAVIACFSPSAPPTAEFARRFDADEYAPPLLTVQFEGPVSPADQQWVEGLGVVDLFGSDADARRRGFKELLIYLGDFFSRPGIAELLPDSSDQMSIDAEHWLHQFDDDPVATQVSSKSGSAIRAFASYQKKLVDLIAKPSPVSESRRLPVWIVLLAIIAAAAVTYLLLQKGGDRNAAVSAADGASRANTQLSQTANARPQDGRPNNPVRRDNAPQPILAGAVTTPEPFRPLGDGEFRDYAKNGFPTPVMVMLQTGQFQMGSDREELGFDKNEFPKHEVQISAPFAIGKYEITEAQFSAFLKDTGQENSQDCEVYEDYNWVINTRREFVLLSEKNRMPAICVSWQDAANYADWLSKQTGFSYRLPTEEEWEYVARAGTITAYSYGNSYEQGCAFMNGVDIAAKVARPELIGAFCDDGFAELAPAGSLTPNAFGLHDMHGNAWEWTADNWTSSHGEDAWTSDARVMKGGSWFSYPLWLRSANRNSLEPDRHRMDVGFRVVRDISEE